MANSDTIEIEILADGTIKFSTSPISSANHVSAEAFLRGVGELAGGETTRTKKPNAKTNEHIHKNDHEHQH